MSENKKSALYYIYKILEEFSDQDHLLTNNDIIEYLENDYEIFLERKAVSNNIALLEEVGFDIFRGEQGGVCLLSRKFDESEIKFIVDAIFSSREISGKQAKALADKVSDCLSKYQRKSYDYLFKSSDINRTNNKSIFYNIEILHEAIKNRKVVRFKYKDFDENGNETVRFNGFLYYVSPYYLVNNFGKYYLLCRRRKYDSLTVFRLDYIRDPEIFEGGEYNDIKEISQYRNGFELTEYLNNHVYLFGGDVVNAKLELKDSQAIGYVKDWFGSNVTILKEGEKLIARIKCDENALYYWALQYIEHVKVVFPIELANKIKESLRKTADEY